MIDPDFTENEALLSQSARSYFDDFVDNGYLNEQQASEDGYETLRWKHMVDLGWTTINLPERVGGAGGTLAEAAVVARECGRAAFASPLLSTQRTTTALESLPGEAFDTVLGRVVDGAPAALIAPADKTLTAVASGGGYRLGGAPTVTTWLATADDVAVFVPLADSPNWLVAVLARERLDPYARAVASIDNERIARLDLDGVTLPADALTLEVPAAQAEYALGRANLLRASAMVGGCEAVVELSARYALSREQFGQIIGGFQAIRHHLGRMQIAWDAARLTTNDALTRATREAADAGGICAVALFVAGRSYLEVVLTGAEVHAGVGTTIEHVLHHHYTRAKAMQLRAGKRANRLREIHDALNVHGEGSFW